MDPVWVKISLSFVRLMKTIVNVKTKKCLLIMSKLARNLGYLKKGHLLAQIVGLFEPTNDLS